MYETAMSQENKTLEPPAKERGGLLRRVFGPDTTPPRPIHSRSTAKTVLDLADIQGFILRGYRMLIVRHFLLTVGVASEARKLLGRLASGDEADAPLRLSPLVSA